MTIDREAGEDARPLHVVTRELRVHPKENYAETDQPLVAHSLGDRVTSVGLQAWFNEPIRLKFLSRVRGYHEIK